MNDELSDQNNEKDSVEEKESNVWYENPQKEKEPESAVKRSGCHSCLYWLAVFCFIFILAAFLGIPQLVKARRSAWENRCKLTLRAAGSAQLAYIDTTAENTYGTFEALQETEFIQPGHTRENFIDNYNIVVFDVDPPTMSFFGLPAYDSTFTIIAIPRTQKFRLRTFGISQAQTLRVWVGDDDDWSTDTSIRDHTKWGVLR